MQAWLVSWDVDTCDLPRLTILGKRVGQTPVGGLETFRRLVKARILVNRSDGTGPTLIRIAKLLFSTDVWYTEGDCEIEIEARAGVSSDVDIGILVSMLRLAKMGGVRLRAIAGIEDSDFLLGLDGAEEIDDHLHGFSDGDADGAGATVGGALAGDW